VELVTIVQIVFVAAAVVTVLALTGAVLDRLRRRVLIGIALLVGIAAAGAWIAYGLKAETEIAVAAGGITISFAAALAAVRLRDLLRASRRTDEQLARAQGRLNSLIAQEAEERSAELERTLVRARADSASLLTEQERRIAEERRAAAAERTRTAGDELGEALTAAQRQVEARLAAWGDDLERAQRGVTDQLAQLAQRQKQLIAEAEARIAVDAERLEGESEQQRAGLVRVREEIARATQEVGAAGTAELEGYASERRRALHELNEREETDATRRIQGGFADVERRQLEHLERILARATTSYSDAATQQFADTVRSSREAAATRLSRELDRAVQAFVREAQTVLADQLAQVATTGAQRLERRQAQVGAGIERQRSEAMEAFESRLVQAEQELRRRLDTLSADTEAERAVLEARLRELSKRIEEAMART
jgi:hypothetical protein